MSSALKIYIFARRSSISGTFPSGCLYLVVSSRRMEGEEEQWVFVKERKERSMWFNAKLRQRRTVKVFLNPQPVNGGRGFFSGYSTVIQWNG